MSTGVGSLAARSFLGGLLPESLLYVLTSSGPQAFAAAMVGDSDTPELVWTHRMRAQRLVPQMHQHLGELSQRLGQHCHKVWEYVACPPMKYPELAEEMWCHRYYLRNLCDEERFSNWPMVDHVLFLQVMHRIDTCHLHAMLHATWACNHMSCLQRLLPFCVCGCCSKCGTWQDQVEQVASVATTLLTACEMFSVKHQLSQSPRIWVPDHKNAEFHGSSSRSEGAILMHQCLLGVSAATWPAQQ